MMSESDAAILVINNLLSDNFSERPNFKGPLAAHLEQLHGKYINQAIDGLQRGVSFSTHACETLVTVARLYGEIRRVEEASQVISSASEQMVASTSQMASSSDEAANKSNSAKDSAQKCAREIGDATGAMKQITGVANTLSDRLEVLEDAAIQIGEMTASIENISSQTKLLALNATIEAARAGESGKGFAVVASEVKSLSEQSAESTSQIRERIETLNSEMAEMKAAMSQSIEAVSQGEVAIAGLHDNIETVTEEIAGASHHMTEIASSLGQQREATSEISEQIGDIASRVSDTSSEVMNVVDSMRLFEEEITHELESYEKMGLANYVLYRAQSDHLIWKKGLAEMLVGVTRLEPSELSDHHSCRLGKWYDAVTDDAIRNDPTFIALINPHERVHTNGKLSAEAFSKGHLEDAQMHFCTMEDASVEVLNLLKELCEKFSPQPEDEKSVGQAEAVDEPCSHPNISQLSQHSNDASSEMIVAEASA